MKRCPQCHRVETDDALIYCRTDGVPLIDDSGSFDSQTAKFGSGSIPSEIETSILPPTSTTPEIQRSTGPTTALPSTPRQSNTRELSKPKRFRILLPLAALAVVAALVAGYFFFSRKSNSIESIAVMPFVNASGNSDVEYLSDGITESLIHNLSQLPELVVKARSTVFYYKGKDISPTQLGTELSVQSILNGRVTQRGDQLMLNLELVDTRTGNQIWGEQYNRKMTDLVSLQSEIARDVTSKLKTKLSGADQHKLAKTYTTDSEAYQLYLKGKFFWNKRTGAALKQAAEFYNQSIEKDPTYALAYSGLAETYVLFSSYDVAPASDSMPAAKAAALRALELDEQLAEAHTALAFYLSNYEWDRSGSEKEYRRAIELKPNYATAHHWFGADLSNIKRFEESLVELKRAEELDPLSRIIGTNLGDTLVHARRYDEAIAQYKRVLGRDPNFAYAHRALGWAFGAKGMYDEAIAETRTAMGLREGSSAKGYLGLWLAKSGRRDEALTLLSQLKLESAGAYVQSYTFALIYIGLGDKEEALTHLEKHLLSRAETASTYATAPELDELRSDPRFKAMLKRMNLPD